MVTEPEGIYIAFPFQLDNGTLAFDVQGGEIKAGIDQIPGSANDWNSVQNYARLANANEQILLNSPEIPLMQFGGINTGRYEAGAEPETTHIFGWPMNNYWVTNFNAEQHGGITWKYTISSENTSSQQSASRFGWENRVSFLSRILPGGGTNEGKSEVSVISGWSENLLLVSLKPDDEGNLLLHVRENAGKRTTLQLKNEISGEEIILKEVDVLGNQIEDGSNQILPFESIFFKITR